MVIEKKVTVAEFSFFKKINLGRAFEHNLDIGGMEFEGSNFQGFKYPGLGGGGGSESFDRRIKFVSVPTLAYASQRSINDV